jgi:hypothetical protein
LNTSEKVEPPLTLQVTIDGQTTTIAAGDTQSVEIDGKAHQLCIESSEHRQFDAAGLRFLYPSGHTWDFDESESSATLWTLDGSDNILMLMRFNEAAVEEFDDLCDTLVEEFTSGYDESEVEVKEASISLGKRGLAGKRLDVFVAGERLRQEIFTFRNGERVFALMVQDTPDDTKETEETRRVKELLASSFEFLTC